ncbi:MAG: glutamate racemase [Verrucomicrobiales bacterium]
MLGILDSGVGGLTVLREIRQLLPHEDLHYVGDSAWVPYGNKSAREIQKRVFAITDFLLAQGASLIVIACNSATISAVEALRAAYPVPFVGMEPGIKPAAALTRSGTIGVLATEASLAGEKFHRLVDTHAGSLRVLTRPCPDFVTLVEAGQLDGPEVVSAIRQYCDPLLAEGADALILGCTHYPFLKAALSRELPDGISLIDTGPAVARRVASLLPALPASLDKGELHLHTTGSLTRLRELAPLLLPGEDPKLSALDLGA